MYELERWNICAGEAKILDLCVEWGLPPCTMLRRLLECCPGLGCKSSKSIGSVFKDASVLHSCISPNIFKDIEAEWGINMYKLHGTEEEFLRCIASDVRESVLVDGICGPASDAARQQAGQRYEHKLYDYLKDHDVSFWTEDELRGRNFYKTPDALLRVPIAVHDKVICWIDSKATFCDARSHKKLLEDQYNSYVNRFGPGLVIYWHGHLETVATMNRDLVTVMDSFPKADEITRLPCL